MLQYASKFTPIVWSAEITALAAGSGNLELLQWLRANGCAWDEDTCAYAARHGRMHVLQWLRANGCMWDSTTCAQAAQHGQLEVTTQNNLLIITIGLSSMYDCFFPLAA